MSEFLKRYIETALVIATLLLVAKLAGVWLGLAMTGATFSFVTISQFISYISLSSLEQVQQITTIADGVFLGVAVAGGTFTLLRSLLLNDLTRHPRTLVKVVHYNLTGWLEDGQSMYPKLFAWVTFLWLTFILILRDYISLGINIWLPVTIGLFSTYFTYQIFSFLDTHITDMISYIYGSKRKTT